MKGLIVFLAAFLLAAPAWAQPNAIQQQHEQMLYPVVDGAITISEEWDPKKGEEAKVERRQEVTVNSWEYNDFSRAIGTRGKKARIAAYDKKADLALLRLVDTERGVEHVAALTPEEAPLFTFELVWTVGSGFGKPPFPTAGELAHQDEQKDGYRYILATAPIIFGNSGGATFHYSAERERYEIIGVPARLSGSWFTGPVTHMAWSIPMETVRAFLRDNDLGFVVGDDDG